MRREITYKGFVNFENDSYPFLFDTQKMRLSIFPNNNSQRNKNRMKVIQEDRTTEDKFEWVKTLKLCGNVDINHDILFYVLDNPSNDDGFLSFNVDKAVLHTKSFSLDKICGIKFLGNLCRSFYSPKNTFETKLTFKKCKGNIKFDNLEAKVNKNINVYCGRYKPSKDIYATIYAEAYALHNPQYEKFPWKATSSLIVNYSQETDIDTVCKTYFHIVNLFQFLTYSKNVDFYSIELFNFNEDKLRVYNALLITGPYKKESDDIDVNKMINFDIIKTKCGMLLTNIKNKKINMLHYCNNNFERKSYGTSRFFEILSAFESEYNLFYGKKIKHKIKHYEIKNELLNYLNKIKNSNKYATGYKRYINRYKKHIVDLDDRVAFETKLRKAITDFNDYLFDTDWRKTKSYRSYINSLCHEMGVVRNHIAHGSLDYDIKPEYLNYIKIIEKMIYILQLKRVNAQDDCINRVLSEIF